MAGTSYAESNPTPAGRAALSKWMDDMPLPDTAERPRIKSAAITAFDTVMQRKADETQKFWSDEGVALGRGWALKHALSGSTFEEQRKGLRAELIKRSRTYPESVRSAFKQGVWAGFDGARQNMHRTVLGPGRRHDSTYSLPIIWHTFLRQLTRLAE
jgi:hypothetical protein